MTVCFPRNLSVAKLKKNSYIDFVGIHGNWYISLHEWLILMVNIGKSTSPMDPVGLEHIGNTLLSGCNHHHQDAFTFLDA